MMALTAPSPRSAGNLGVAHVGEALHGALRHLSWRIVGATFAISLALDAWTAFEIQRGGTEAGVSTLAHFTSGAVINLAMSICLMLTTRVADELVASGAKRARSYAWAVVIGCAMGSLVQWAVYRALGLPDLFRLDGASNVVQPWATFFEYLIWGSMIVFLYVNGRTALLASARMNAARVQRADAKRRTLEARLQALQARVEPEFLFGTLGHVRELYRSDPPRAAELLDDLIAYLRSALPQLRESTSTVERELMLVNAYRSIMRSRLGERLVLDIDVPAAERLARMPPMILLPLLNHALKGARSATIRIAAQAGGNRLRVELSQPGRSRSEGSSELCAIRERLQGLYGARETPHFETAADRACMVMEIPYELAERGHS